MKSPGNHRKAKEITGTPFRKSSKITRKSKENLGKSKENARKSISFAGCAGGPLGIAPEISQLMSCHEIH
jgi:hypothetical protein